MFFKKKKLTEIEFSKKFAVELLKEVQGLEIISIEELEIRTKFEDLDDSRHFLDNCYSEYLNDSKNIKEIIQRYVNGAKGLYLPDEPINLDRIVPIIKDKRFLDELKKIDSNFEQNHVFEQYNSELFIFYAEDKENSIDYLTQIDFETLCIEREKLKSIAITNLEQILSIEINKEDGYYMLIAGGTYESSLILIDFWNNDNFPVNGNFIIGIPARDILLITGSNDSRNLHKMYDTVNDINKTGNHLVSSKLFELRNGKFEVL